MRKKAHDEQEKENCETAGCNYARNPSSVLVEQVVFHSGAVCPTHYSCLCVGLFLFEKKKKKENKIPFLEDELQVRSFLFQAKKKKVIFRALELCVTARNVMRNLFRGLGGN